MTAYNWPFFIREKSLFIHCRVRGRDDRLLMTENCRHIIISYYCIDYCLRERQLRLYGHVARLPAEDPAHRILSCRDPRGWIMPRGRPQASWLGQVESYLKDMGMAGMASAWVMARRRPI